VDAADTPRAAARSRECIAESYKRASRTLGPTGSRVAPPAPSPNFALFACSIAFAAATQATQRRAEVARVYVRLRADSAAAAPDARRQLSQVFINWRAAAVHSLRPVS
jgi:hypothetical protein